LQDLFIAALDTTSNTIEWAMAELLQNPEAMRKLQEELGTVLGSKSQVEDSDIDKLPYLRAVIKETLRLHSVVPLVSYRAQATVQVQGYTIPEGSNVLVNVWAIHHNPDVWKEPYKFLPERFLEKEVEFLGRNFEFIPFGSGRHICLGLPLANRMLHLMLGSLLHRFDWELPELETGNGLDMTEKFGLVLSMANPIHTTVKKKQH
jgi:cytochrome P450